MHPGVSRKVRFKRYISDFSNLAVYPFPLQENDLLFPDQVESFCIDERHIFKKNLEDSIAQSTAIYTMGTQIASEKLFQRVLAANRIRAIDPSAVVGVAKGEVDFATARQENDELTDRLVFDRSISEFKEIISAVDIPADEEKYFHVEEAFKESLRLLGDVKIRNLNEILLRSAQAQIWTSFEIFVKDLLRSAVNELPELTISLENNAEFKKRFNFPKLTFSDLSQGGFDLRSSSGNFIFDRLDFSSIKSIRVIINALGLRSDALDEKMSSTELRSIFLKRNVIVHRGGMIDKLYSDMPSCNQKLGDIIVIPPKEYVSNLQYVWSVGGDIFDALNRLRGGRCRVK